MSKKFYKILTKELLIQEYTKNRKSQVKIANEINSTPKTIRNYLRDYNIKIRTKSESNKGISRNQGNKNGRYLGARTLIKHYCIEPNCNNEISYKAKRCPKCSMINKWQNKDFREKVIKAVLKSLKLKPNKSEKLLNKILQDLLPRKYKFVGNGKVIIGGFCPDFINVDGQKKIIELYGCYWHNLPNYIKRDIKRLIAYKRYGYKTLIIWEHELKDLQKVKERILKFN